MITNNSVKVGRCGVVDSTLAFGSIGHGFESEHSLFSHHGASAFSKLRSLDDWHDALQRVSAILSPLSSYILPDITATGLERVLADMV